MANGTKRIFAQDFQNEINKLLDEYGDEVMKTASKIAHVTAKGAASKLKSNNVGDFKNITGSYRSGWRANISVASHGLKFVATTYNQTDYQLTHLLENQHDIISHGKYVGETNAHPHIYAVNEWAQKEFIDKLEAELNEKR